MSLLCSGNLRRRMWLLLMCYMMWLLVMLWFMIRVVVLLVYNYSGELIQRMA